MERDEIVGTHDPDVPVGGSPPEKAGQRINGIAGAKPCLKIADRNPALPADQLARRTDAAMERGLGRFLERIAGANNPPHCMQAQPAKRLAGHMQMPLMRRIERAPQQPDSHGCSALPIPFHRPTRNHPGKGATARTDGRARQNVAPPPDTRYYACIIDHRASLASGVPPMAPQYIYHMDGVSLSHPGGKNVLENIHLSFLPGAKIGVIGPNGSGKSTLLRIMAGIEREFAGEARAARGVTVGYLPQEPQLDPARTVRENVLGGVAEDHALLQAFEEASRRLGEEYSDDLLENMSRIQEQIEDRDLWNLDSRVDVAMEALRCPPNDAPAAQLSGGERRRVALCRLLLGRPDLLLLDEPTNHLDAESVAWLQKHLEAYAGTVMLVTHDRYFLDQVTGWTLELDRGRGLPFKGNYSSWMEQRSARFAYEGKEREARARILARELEWIRQSPRARQAKSKARIHAYEQLAGQSERERVGQAQIVIPRGPRLGSLVVEAKGIAKAYGDRLLFENLDFLLPPGGIVGIIGPNGAGKTTLCRMLAGMEAPDRGEIRTGESVSIAYVDQVRDALDPARTVWEEISDCEESVVLGDAVMNSRAYAAAFNFRGPDQQKRVGELSGGERNRVHLAKLLKSGANVIILDEPTNDLDVETLRALEEALLAFAGCAVIVSHDRYFLDRVCSHILAFEGNSRVEWFEGNFEAYEEDKIRRYGPESVRPTRIQYKKFLPG